MKLRSPWLIRIAAFAIAVVLRLWLATVRARIVSVDHRQHPADPKLQRFIYAFWHESFLAPVKMRTAAKVLVSQSADGELIAQVCRHLGIGSIRGSTSRGGAQGLLSLIRECTDAHLAITPDGPRGPRRKLQPGVVFVASHTGLAIVPVGVGFTRAWRAGSWDRFAMPRPGSIITGVVGAPIAVPAQLAGAALEQHRIEVEAALLTVTQAAERWAEEIASGRRRASHTPAPHEIELFQQRASDGGVAPVTCIPHTGPQFSQV